MKGNKERTIPDEDVRKAEREIQDVQIRERLNRIRNKILVMSGKGGVGKSSVAAYLAVSLAKKGYKVGLMDVDLHGPSIPRLLGLKGNIKASKHQKGIPLHFSPNMQVISIEALLPNKDSATIWRGPLKIGIIRQFISDIEWMDHLDYLIVDSPPGTGDEPLTVAQTIRDAKAIIVTTPQEVSLADVRKSINFCRNVHMGIIGLIENMSGFHCPHCGKSIDIFKAGGGERTAKAENLRLLGKLPIEPEIVKHGDTGNTSILDNDDIPFTKEFNKIVGQVIEILDKKDENKIVEEKEKSAVDLMEVEKMDGKILFAIPTAQGKLCSHFGHSEMFSIIQTENGKITDKKMLTPPPHEPGVLPRWLHEMGVNVIIAGGMGSRAQSLFNQAGIKVVVGAPVDTPESLVNQYLANTLVTGENVCDH